VDEPLTIGLLIDDSLDRPDGVQQYVLTLGAWLTAQGHTVHYITASTERTDLPHLHVIGRTVNVTFNGNGLGTPLPVSGKASRALTADLGLDVLHVQMPYSPFLAGRVISAADASATTAVVGTFHIYPQSRLVSVGARILGLLERRRLRAFDAFLAVSEAAQSFAAQAFRIDTTVIGNPVVIEQFAPSSSGHSTAAVEPSPSSHTTAAVEPGSEEPSPSAQSTAAVEPGREAADGRDPAGTPVPHIVFLGRLVERKGPRELMEALVRLHSLSPDVAWRATIAGRGPMLTELQAMVVKDGLDDQVTFPGFIAEEDKAALLSSADIVALPSTGGESFGISVVEALAASTGVVLAGDNPGYRTVMRGLEEQLVDPKDTTTFSRIVSSWMSELQDPESRMAVVDAQHQAAARFDVNVIGTRVVEQYRAAMAHRAGR
jgi:phosphatidylinositol alpha-mannosyltransferase